ncbi:MAG TPA: hypothetical protein VNH11_27595 [Pirellulales bacterium]|nr:hypothetical protein [Pirellulales bacterium]
MRANLKLRQPAGGPAWSRRPRRETTIVADRWIWRDRGGRYRVVRSRSRFGIRPDTWYALHLADLGGRRCWSILSRHRRRGAAFAACDRHAARLRNGRP